MNQFLQNKRTKNLAIGGTIIVLGCLAELINFKINPDHFYVRCAQFDALVLHQLPKEIGNLDRAISFNAKKPSYYNARATACFEVGQIQKALDDYTTYISFHPKDVDHAYTERAACFLKLGQYSKALADTNSAISLNPRAGWAYWIRASVFDKLGKHDLAEADRRKAKELGYGAGLEASAD